MLTTNGQAYKQAHGSVPGISRAPVARERTPRAFLPLPEGAEGLEGTGICKSTSIRPGWHISDRICGLCDHERHLAHIVKLGKRWFAFDSTHSSGEDNGFLFLGSFVGKVAAMEAAEQATFHRRGRGDPAVGADGDNEAVPAHRSERGIAAGAS